MLIGYARCSSSKDDEKEQRDQLRALGVGADSIHVDHGLTGADRPRPALTAALSALAARDTLVVTRLARLARSVGDLSEIAADHQARDVLLMFDGTVHDPQDPIGATVFTMFATTFAEFESGLIHLRTMEGNARRKAAGGFVGRKPLLGASQQSELYDLHQQGDNSAAELMQRFNLSHAGLYKYLAREKARRLNTAFTSEEGGDPVESRVEALFEARWPGGKRASNAIVAEFVSRAVGRSIDRQYIYRIRTGRVRKVDAPVLEAIGQFFGKGLEYFSETTPALPTTE